MLTLEQQREDIVKQIDYIKLVGMPILIISTFVVQFPFSLQELMLFVMGIGLSIISFWLTLKIRYLIKEIKINLKWILIEIAIDLLLIASIIYLTETINSFILIVCCFYLLRITFKYGKFLGYLALSLILVLFMLCRISCQCSLPKLITLLFTSLIVTNFIRKLVKERKKKDKRIKELTVWKHDIKNQLQTATSLIKLEKYDRALDYLQEINSVQQFDEDELVKLTDIDESPVIYSLLISKVAEAKRMGIKLEVDFEIPLQEAEIPDHKWVIIISNLIDNAFDELSDNHSITEPVIKLNSCLVQEKIRFVVYNNYSVIPSELQTKIFDLGVSTKGKKVEDRGCGLYIVKRIVEEYDGVINVISNSKVHTKFVIEVPSY